MAAEPVEHPPEDAAEAPLGGRMMRGAAWMVGLRWVVRGLGLISFAVLARLLDPADFGIVAMAMVVVALVEVLRDFGIDMALIRIRDIRPHHYHTAWTFTLLAGLICAAILLAAAPFAARAFADDRVLDVLYALALLPVLNGLENVKTVDFRRDLEFGKDFAYNVMARVVGVVAAIALAVALRDYWALVYGMLAQSAIRLVVGYAMMPFLPRPSLRASGELLSFSVWILVRSISQVVTVKLDQFWIGRHFGPADLGGYHVSQEISGMVTMEVVLPLGRSLLPGYARMTGQLDRLRNAFEKVLAFHVIVAPPLGIGLALVAPDFVPVVLGEKWVAFVPLFQVFGVAAGIGAVSSAAGPLMVAIGAVRALAVVTWVQLGLALAVIAAIAVAGGDILAFAWGRLGLAVVMTAVYLAVSARFIGLPLARLIGPSVRVGLALLVMALAVIAAGGLAGPSPWVSLPLEVLAGAAAYGATLLLVWRAMGRPEGVERDVTAHLVGAARAFSRGAG